MCIFSKSGTNLDPLVLCDLFLVIRCSRSWRPSSAAQLGMGPKRFLAKFQRALHSPPTSNPLLEYRQTTGINRQSQTTWDRNGRESTDLVADELWVCRHARSLAELGQFSLGSGPISRRRSHLKRRGKDLPGIDYQGPWNQDTWIGKSIVNRGVAACVCLNVEMIRSEPSPRRAIFANR